MLGSLVRRSPGSPARLTVFDGRPAPEAVDAIYQTEGCSEHTYYVATKRPRGRWSKIADQLSLAGTASNAQCAAYLEDFIFGDQRWLQFEEDPSNTYDPHAIRVLGIWTDRTDRSFHCRWIGWVSKKENQRIYEDVKRRAVIGVPKVIFYGGTTIGMRFNIYLDQNIDVNNCRDALKLLTRQDGATAKEIGEISPLVTRSRLDKLSNREIVTAIIMEAFSGHRIEKKKRGNRVAYFAVADASMNYQQLTGWDPNAYDPMGADVPSYARRGQEALGAPGARNQPLADCITEPLITQQQADGPSALKDETNSEEKPAVIHQAIPAVSGSSQPTSSRSWWRRLFG